jgi:hypothetical protein
MNLTELRAEVVTLTSRPDLDVTGQILLAVRNATLKMHQVDYFPKDIYEVTLAFTTSTFLQQFDLPTNIPRWRALKYLRKYDITTGTPGKFFEPIVPENVLDDYSVQRDDVVYLGGDTLQIRSSTAFQHALLGAYLNPDITVSGYTSWIARDYPYVIVNEAAAIILKISGKDEEARLLREMNNENIALLRISNTLAQGY